MKYDKKNYILGNVTFYRKMITSML